LLSENASYPQKMKNPVYKRRAIVKKDKINDLKGFIKGFLE
jgi:hypothetical protein